MSLLTLENYKNGFLVDDEVIAGVTEMAGGVYSAYVTHYLTSEVFDYREFDNAPAALEYLNAIARPWIYESVGCSSKTSKPSSGGCGSCSGGGCATSNR